MKTLLFCGLAASLALLCAPAASHAQNAVANSDFSSNAASFITNPGYSGQGSNPTITGWTGTGLNGTGQGLFGINGNGTGASVQNVFGPSSLANLTGAKDFAFLQNGSGGVTSLTQGITLVPGQLYTLSFEAAARKDDPNGTTYTVPTGSVTITPTVGTAYTLNATGLSKLGFMLYSGTFTAGVGSDTLSITNNNPLDGSAFDISDLSVTPVVPEPATWMGGAAVGLLGLVVARRRRSA